MMDMESSSRKIAFVLLGVLLCGAINANSIEIVNLLVEYEQTPLAIDTQKPRFSWQMMADEDMHNCRQTAYRIVVNDEKGRQVWDSGKVDDGRSLNIIYNGDSLTPTTRYNWQLDVWDQENRLHHVSSWFETSLMTDSDKDKAWASAQWIGTKETDQYLFSHYLPVFRLAYAVQLDKTTRSTRASILYGCNDERLMEPGGNLWHLSAKRDSSYIRIELNTDKISEDGEAVVSIYRRGYNPEESGECLMAAYGVPKEVVSKANLYDSHRISIASCLGDTKVEMDDMEIGALNLNPLGKGGDFMAYPVVGDVGISLEKGQKAYFSEFEIANYRSPGNTIANIPELENTFSGGTLGYIKVINPSRNGMPMLRSSFEIDREIASARLYVTARGVYDFYVNGSRIGTDYLNPGITQYNKTHLYQTFDITKYLTKGQNAVGAILGEGWWSGGATYEGQNWNYFGDRLSLLAKIQVRFTDGSCMDVVSSPQSWKYTTEGPVRYGSLFQGEVYDARREMMTWASADYDDSRWLQTIAIPLEGHVSSSTWGNGPALNDYSDYHLISQFGQTIHQHQRLNAISVNRLRPSVYIYDMGQNMVGVPDIRLTGLEPGTKVKFRYAEVLYPEHLPEYAANKGELMQENIRAAMAQDIYIAKGGEERFSPRFTNHGYRYLEITGIDHALPLADAGGIVLSSIDQLSASYETSDSLVNRLWQNIKWSALGNFVSIPTDCPQRNERLGWAGDISVFSRTATYMALLPQFLRRYLRAMRDVQRDDGRMPDVAPLGGGFGGLLWGSASITVAWESYQQYADTLMLTEHYGAMKRYIDYVLSKTIDHETGIIVQDRAWGDLGDWLGLEDEKNDKSLFWESYLIYDLSLMQHIATILGEKNDAERYANICKQRKDFFINTYLRPSDFKTISSGFGNRPKGGLVDTQTSYVLPLALGVLEGDTARLVASNLKQTVERRGTMDNGRKCPPFSLLTGFIGTSWISKALSDAGYDETAYRLLLQQAYPSWLYPVTQGATTIWERLNSYTHTDGFGGNNRMNSFNHYSFGSVGAWMYNYSIGIQRDEQSPGFRHFVLRPIADPTGKITWAKGHYDSMYGRIESSWQRGAEGISYRFTIPANTTATLLLGNKEIELPSGSYHFKTINGILMEEKNNKNVDCN